MYSSEWIVYYAIKGFAKGLNHLDLQILRAQKVYANSYFNYKLSEIAL